MGNRRDDPASALLLSLFLAAGLVACDGSGENAPPTGPEASPSQAALADFVTLQFDGSTNFVDGDGDPNTISTISSGLVGDSDGTAITENKP